MKKRRLFMLALVLLVLAALVWSLQPAGLAPAVRAQPVIGLLHLEGPFVTGGAPGGMFGGVTSSDWVVRQLEMALDDPAVRAVVIRINSPGGSAAAAHEVGEAVNRLKARIPVVASMADVAASGGYWVASQASTIVANPSTMTGSIGVIM
ncbi:MAG TPA: signal peptide peptidase SppA, partial [Clostridiales bacterium UBA8153]|nr:signal peptide peptidase SppA [Clostridiales bacterium UBA8153]